MKLLGLIKMCLNENFSDVWADKRLSHIVMYVFLTQNETRKYFNTITFELCCRNCEEETLLQD
jgi:hypothetical protein